MDDWDIIKCGFNTADETLNFGTRNFARGDNLYEACTLASLKCNKPESSTVNLRAVGKASGVFLSINNTLKIFANALCNELSLSLCFEEVIDTFCVTNDGRFLVICLRNGIIHCIDVEDGNKVVFSNSVCDEVSFVDCFIENYNESAISILAAISDGRVFRMSFEFDGEKSEADEVLPDLIIDFNCFIKCASFNGSVILADGEKMCVYDIPNEDSQICDGLNLKQIYPYNNSLFICIDEYGNLIQVCSSTLLHIKLNSDVKFESFVFTQNPSGISQILAHTKPDLGEPKIQALTYPGLALLFSLKTGEAIRLMQPENVHDEYMYVSMLKSEGITDELRILQLVDTAPENHLKRILRRGKFKEALFFARSFNLDVVEVWKAKAEFIVEKLTCDRNDMQELLAILSGIKNEVSFKIRCCLAVFKYCEEMESVQDVLSYGCSCLSDYTEVEDMEEVQELMEMISEVMNRFKTFTLIQKQGEYDVDWERFSECNLFDLVCESLQKSNIEQAIIIYSRMDFSYSSEVDKLKIQEILSLLNDLSLNACTSFLFSFLPITLKRAPGTLPLFVYWIQKQKLFSIESAHSRNFPQNAMDFLDVFLRILNFNNVNSQGELHSLLRSAISELTFTMKTLKSLKLLKEAYDIVIPLKDYMKSPRALISILLTVRLNEKVYQDFLSKFLCGYILENHFEPDEVFLKEICSLVKHKEQYWIKVMPSILQCIKATEVKLNAVIQVLENADVPWCETIRDIAKSSLRYKHGLVNVIKDRIKEEPNQIVLQRPKYNFPRDVNISEDLSYIIGRIIYCNEPTLIDDALQFCTDSEQTAWVIVRLIDSFARAGNIPSVVEVLNKMKPSETDNICASIVVLIECYDNFKSMLLPEIIQNYPSMLNLLQTRGSKYVESIKTCRNFLKIKEEFCPEVRMEQLHNARHRQQLLSTILSDVAFQFSQGTLNVGESVERCRRISVLLGVSKEDVMVGFCQKLNSFDSIVKFIDALCFDESTSENLCLTAVLIMKSVSSWRLQLDASSFQEEGALTTIDTYLLGFKLAQKLSVLAILRSNPNDIGACIPVYDWVMSTFYSRSNCSLDLWEKRPLKSPGFGTFQSFRFIFTAFTQLAVGYNNPDLKYLTYFDNQANKLTEEQCVETVERLPMLINSLCMEGHNLTASKLVITLKNALFNFGCASSKAHEMLHDILINHCVPQILQKLFSARNIDIESAYLLLINLKQKDPLKEIKNYLQVNKRNTQKLATLAKLALRIMKYQGITTTGSDYIKIVLLSKWWEKISECQLSLKEFFTTSPITELLAKLIEHRHLSLEMLTEFCADFNLDLQTSYITYLKALFTKWTPDYTITDEEFAEAKITVKNYKQLFEACREVIELIDDKESVAAAINNFYRNINFYHYEVFMCVFKIWKLLKQNVDSTTKKTMLLSFLSTYRRVRAPSTFEIEEWFSAFPNSQHIDPLSQWRLPFTHTLFTKDVQKIIRPELNLKTYTVWFDAVQILDKTLNKDDICIYAIKEVVSSNILKQNENKANLFEEIDSCVENITDYEKATSVVYHLLTQTPEGTDQVIAAELCLKYATLYKKRYSESDPSVLDAFTKVNCKYLYISGSHILRKHKLIKDKYIKMLPHSHDLISALYMDLRLLKRTYDCPDINKAVDELSTLFKIDVQEKRAQLLEGYLSKSNPSHISLNDSSPWSINEDCEFGIENNIKRALYICQSGELKHWQDFLLEKGFSERKSLSFRANALKCLCAISSPESIEALTNIPYNAFVRNAEKLSLLNDLQSVVSSIDINQLDTHKMLLLKRLSQDLDNPFSVKAVTSICIIYEVEELQYWEKIVKASIELKLHQNLKNSLNFLNTIGNVKHRKFYTDAWQTLINHSFSVLTGNKEDAYSTCIENILLLQTCPVLFSLDFKKVFKSCCKLQLFEFAAIMLQYLLEEDQFDYVKEILQCNPDNLLMNIKKLSMQGIWGTSCVLDLLCSVIDSSRIS